MLFVVWPVARYTVTVMICCALMGKLIGSETASAPLGTVMPSLPPKVTFWMVLGWTWWIPAVWFKGRATVTAVMGRLDPPKTLENFRRIWRASVVMKRVWRMVLFTKTAPVWFWYH